MCTFTKLQILLNVFGFKNMHVRISLYDSYKKYMLLTDIWTLIFDSEGQYLSKVLYSWLYLFKKIKVEIENM